MHELTLAEHVLRIVAKAAEEAHAARVTRITLSIGALAHADPETMQYCCGVLSKGTLAEGARIDVQRMPGRARCMDCAVEVALNRVGEPCPHCGGYRLEITGGDQMQVVDIGVE